MTEEEMKRFFDEYKDKPISAHSSCRFSIPIEQLFKAFKTRLASESVINLFPNEGKKS